MYVHMYIDVFKNRFQFQIQVLKFFLNLDINILLRIMYIGGKGRLIYYIKKKNKSYHPICTLAGFDLSTHNITPQAVTIPRATFFIHMYVHMVNISNKIRYR
jgi:hypothetical protein